MACVDVIVSDFDNTLFKRNFGLIQSNVSYLEEQGLPIVIITYREANQQQFILDTLAETNLNIVSIGFGGSKKKDPLVKFVLMKQMSKKYHVKEALDDEQEVVLAYRQLGINARQV